MPRKRTHQGAQANRQTIHDGQTGIMADNLIAQPTPQALFDDPQIGGLTNKGGAMQTPERRKKVLIVLPKVGKELLLLGQTQVASHYFHRDHFTICQLGDWAFGSQPWFLQNHWHHPVNRAETCDNKIVQV